MRVLFQLVDSSTVSISHFPTSLQTSDRVGSSYKMKAVMSVPVIIVTAFSSFVLAVALILLLIVIVLSHRINVVMNTIRKLKQEKRSSGSCPEIQYERVDGDNTASHVTEEEYDDVVAQGLADVTEDAEYEQIIPREQSRGLVEVVETSQNQAYGLSLAV